MATGDIQLSANFQNNTAKPLDAKEVVADIIERDALTFKFAGLRTYVESEDKYYRWDGMQWVDDSAGGSGGAAAQALVNGAQSGQTFEDQLQNGLNAVWTRFLFSNTQYVSGAVSVSLDNSTITVQESGVYLLSHSSTYSEQSLAGPGTTPVAGDGEATFRFIINGNTSPLLAQYANYAPVLPINTDARLSGTRLQYLNAGDTVEVHIKYFSVGNELVPNGSTSQCSFSVSKISPYKGDKGDPGGASIPIQDEGTPIEATPNKINYTGAGVTASQDGSGGVNVNIPGQPPITGTAPLGAIIMWMAGSPPTDWLVLNRQAVSRTTFSALLAWAQANGVYDATGVNTLMFGPGDGSTTFDLPDYQSRSPVGASVGTDHELGDGPGVASHVLTHNHTIPGEGALLNALLPVLGTVGQDGVTGDALGTIDNRPPQFGINFCIYAGQ